MDKKSATYKDSGVDIDAGQETIRLIRSHVESTHSASVLAGVGAFGGLIDMSEILKKYKNPVLAQSIDGVGTKLMVATMADNHSTIGMDIVNHGCNDVLCQGAMPVTFLDYVAMSKLSPKQVEEIVKGMAQACRAAGVAMIGGETAELPGIYRDKEYDVAGVITGIVERDEIVTGESIEKGQILIGLASSGLHTNGYTLARTVFFDIAKLGVNDKPNGLDGTAGDLLLKPHINYAPAVLEILKKIKVHGMAHITGGGLVDNLARILPENRRALIKRDSWKLPPLFDFIQQTGNVPQDDMDRTFNMGIGYILVVEETAVEETTGFFNSKGHPAFRIGAIEQGEKGVLIN